MKNLKKVLYFLLIFEILKSCLVPPAPHHHYFTTSDSVNSASNPTLMIFSTPRVKYYVIENISVDSKAYIQSGIFENPKNFYLAENKDFFGEDAKQYALNKNDGKFYGNKLYEKVTLKILNNGSEKIIEYKLTKK